MEVDVFRTASIEDNGEARKKRVIAYMIEVYGDDSSDGKHERVFAVAALIGFQEVWDSLKSPWEERTGGIPYHATDCLAGRGAYKGWSKEKSYSLHNDLARLIVDFPIVGNAFVMDLASFAEIMHGVKRTENFLYCFAHMVAGACAIIRSYNHENNQKKQRAKFVFDSDNDKFNAGYLYSVLTKMKRWEEITADCEDSVEFAFNPKPAGIQAADLWVYEVRNEFDNKLKSINTKTYASHILSPEYPRFLRNEYFRSNIIGSKNRIDQMGNESQYLDAYKEWLLKHHRQDNPTSKIAFTAYWDVLHKKE